MKTTLLSIALFLCGISMNAQAQKVTFVGEVRDSLNNKIQFANVMALDTAKNTIVSFAVTDQQGFFRLSLEKNKAYNLKVSFVGFKSFEAPIKGMDTKDAPLLIKLNPDTRMVEGVEVVHEMPVVVSGDTITYKTDAFTEGTERKLEDVLEKLPGFEVDDNGEVKVQGKKVDKVLVEGKEFFEGDTKMATKNLPANAVDKVQVLQDYNEVSPMQGLGTDERLALNIQLKEDKKNIVFGDIEAGAGPEERFLGEINAFYYNPKTTLNLIAGANNIGDQTFTVNDFFRFNGGFMSLGRSSGSNLRISADNIGIPTATKDNAISIDTRLAALNFNHNPSSKWKHSGFFIGSMADNSLGSVSQRTYIRQDGDNQEVLTSNSRVENSSGMLKLKSRFTPNADLQIDYSVLGKMSDLSNVNTQLSQFTNFDNNITAGTTQQPFSLDQQLQAFYAPTVLDVFSFQITHQYRRQDPFYDLLTTQRPFITLVPTGDAANYNLLQAKEVFTRKQESVLNYYRILNKTNHINFKVGNSYTSQTLTSGLSQRRPGAADLEFGDPALNNDVDYSFSDIYFGIGYKTKLGKLTLGPGLNLHRYSISNTQLGVREELKKTLLLPQLYAKYAFRGSHSLTLNYSINAEFTDVQNMASGLVVQNYNTLFQGNQQLENSWYHSVNLNYFNFDMYNFTNIYGSISYQRRYDGITNAIQFAGLERINSPLNIGVANEMLMGSMSFDKRFDGFRINFRANISESTNNNLVSDIATENTSFTQNYRFTFDTNIFKKFNVQLMYSKIFNEYNGNAIRNKFETDRPAIEIDWRFLKGFRLEVDYEYNKYVGRNSGVSQSYDLMNADLTYHKPKSKWEFKLAALNLLNTTSIRQDSFSESLISTFEYFIQKRFFMFTVKYDL